MIKKIDTGLKSQEIFSLFQDRKHCFFLDSAMHHEKLGRYSIIVFDPSATLESKNGVIRVEDGGGCEVFAGDPFEALKSLLKRQEPVGLPPGGVGASAVHDNDQAAALDKDQAETEANQAAGDADRTAGDDTALPFTGGAVGYLGYDLCHHIETLPRTAVDDTGIADCFFGLYDGAVVIDHFEDTVYAASGADPETACAWIGKAEEVLSAGSAEILTSRSGNKTEYPGRSVCRLEANLDRAAYDRAIGKIREYIRSGDIYQVNMTQRFRGETAMAPYELYCRLREINPAPFACYGDCGSAKVISSSPERFLQIRDRIVETRPIKGTRPRGATPEEDRAYARELLNSEKDRAELLMIVDLERNDLGKVCEAGSVRVPELFSIEGYASVNHLVASVEGRLPEGVHAADCLKAMFPGGSITGAPKIRAMEIIDELEPTQRGIYTGSVGYIGFDGNADFNIAIRTIVWQEGRISFQAGGGIVWDSEAQAEYDEMLCKAAALIKAAVVSLPGVEA